MLYSLDELFKAQPEVVVDRDGAVADLGYVDSYVQRTLAYAEGQVYLTRALKNPNVSAVLTTSALRDEARNGDKAIATCEWPRAAFYELHEEWVRQGWYTYPVEAGQGARCEIHSTAIVGPNVELGDRVVIGPYSIVDGPVRIGNGARIEAGARIGVDGILYVTRDGEHRTVRHGGWVDIGANVTLFSGATIVRSVHPSSPTVVGDGSIVGINAIVGHDARLGAAVVVSGQSVIARRARLGNNVYIGTHVFVREHVCVAEASRVMAGAIVIEDVGRRGVVSGNFAEPHHKRMMHHAKSRLA